MYSRFQEEYKRKYRSLEDVAKLIKTGDKILSNQCVSEPVGLLNAIGKRAMAKEFDDVEYIGFGPTLSLDWIKPEVYPHLRVSTAFIFSPKVREAVNKGYASFIPNNAHSLPETLTNYMFISIPFAALKAQNVMKRVGFERYFIYPINVGIAVNYKPRGGEWATPNTE